MALNASSQAVVSDILRNWDKFCYAHAKDELSIDRILGKTGFARSTCTMIKLRAEYLHRQAAKELSSVMESQDHIEGGKVDKKVQA